MKAEKKLAGKVFEAVNKAAVQMVKHNVNSCCTYIFHQPEVPETANKFKKVKK